jgi:hypothetical protein
MANFEGTVEEFIKFVGPYARNSVQSLSKELRSKKKCEECGSRTKKLDAAHKKGFERNKIIVSILADNMEENTVDIDLGVFSEKFKAAHTPPEKVIRILCKECHRKYDKTDPDDYEEIEKNDIIESENMVKDIIDSWKNSKKNGIEIAVKNGFRGITGNNSIFANVNNAVNVWWLEPDNRKFSEDLYFLLSNANTKKLSILKIPAGTISSPATTFRQRTVHGKAKSSIEIVVDANNHFVDRKLSNFDFSPFLEKTLGFD